ncbi:MAG: hypothetical protein ACIAQ0_00390 [Phycisphaerales bacterium JB058]
MAKKKSIENQIREGLSAGEQSDTIMLAIPSHDQQQVLLVNQGLWADDALAVFADLYGGATAFQAYAGIYKSTDGRHLRDNTIMVECLCNRDDAENPIKIRTLCDFCRRMKEETNQEAVMLVVNNMMYFV